MIGLRARERDPSLTAACGDPAVPPESEVLELVARHFASASSAELVYARWKPRTALCLGYQTRFDDGSTRCVTLKLHTGDKARTLVAATSPSFAVEPARGATLSLFPFDRELPGLERGFDPRRLARYIDSLGCYLPLLVRPGPSKVTTLRYKPERRAVLKLELKLRERDDAPRVARTLVARIHTQDSAQRSAGLRAAFQAAAPRGIVPALVDCEARTGTLLEEWLAVVAFAPDEFEHARGAGALLARMHATPCNFAAPAPELDGLDELFAIDPGLARRARGLPAAESPSTVSWTHGDFHPDQVATSEDGSLRLLDLDQLGPGAPCRDLASWIADHVAFGGIDWRSASRALLDGYRSAGGRVPREGELARSIARELRRLAAGALRRLERDAFACATRLLDLAHEVAPAPSTGSRLSRAIAAVAPHAVNARCERVDLGRARELRITLSEHGAQRWFEVHDSRAIELAPDSDRELPLALALPSLAQAGSVSVLTYKPGRRIVLRVTRESGERVVLKGYRAGRSASAQRAHDAARCAASDIDVRVPALLAHDTELATLAFEDLGGSPCDLAGLAPERLERFGAALRRFQGGATDGLPAHDAIRELAVLDEHFARALEFASDGLGYWRSERDSLGRAAQALPHACIALAHRDLHDGQLLELGSHFGWIDFDLASAADTALDAANLCAHTELRVLQNALDATHADALRAHFLRGFDGAREGGFAARFDFYRRASLLRLALVYRLRPRWSHLSFALTERATSSNDA